MKKRFLKNYETFKDEQTNENTHYNYGFDNFQTISEEEESSKKEVSEEAEESTKDCECGKKDGKCDCDKSTKESEEATEDKEECDCGKEDCDCDKDDSTEESEDGTVGVISIEASTDDNDKTDDDVDSSIAVDTDNDGTQDVTNSFNPLESTAREFSVAKIMTKNGAKIMMCYTCDAEDLSTLADNIDFESACKMVETETEQNGLEKFDNANDVNLGGIPSFMMDKKATDSESTSYRP
jgi:hypothetical protein